MIFFLFGRNKKSKKKLLPVKDLLTYCRLPENARFEYITQVLSDGFIIEPDDWCIIIPSCPDAEKLPIPWDKFSPENWYRLLESLPQLIEKCPCLDEFSPEQWCNLLKEYPQWSYKCRCYKDFSEENWIDLCWKHMQFIKQASAFLNKENLFNLAVFHRIRQEKNIWFGPATLKALLKDKDDPCVIFGKRDGLPVFEDISPEWLKKICHQEMEKINE